MKCLHSSAKATAMFIALLFAIPSADAQTGELTAEDKETLGILSQACEDNAVRHCLSVARANLGGESAKAAELFRRACDGGESQGCVYLGWMFALGRGVEQDTARAVSLYRQACEASAAQGCFYLGHMHALGVDVEQDQSAAVSYYQQACELGLEDACIFLGRTE